MDTVKYWIKRIWKVVWCNHDRVELSNGYDYCINCFNWKKRKK
jgi:hypothetical protein